jgi:hypothetical protein
MNSKTTGIWFVIAAALLAFIFIFEHYLSPAVAGPAPLLPNLRPAAVTSVQVFPPPGTPEIEVNRTNGGWVLVRPVSYPAQTAAIGALLDALQKLAPRRISAAELRERKDYESEFGLDHPQASLVIIADGQRRQLEVGNRTAPGDQVYLRVVGMDGVAVADAAWLNLIPHAADEWRDTALVNAGQNDIDWIVLTNNARGIAIELRRDPTNHLWRILRPSGARADTDHITDLLQRLAAASVTRFVTDDPNADLTAFGLQPADLDLWLGRGTNLVAAVHVGKSPTNDASQVYAKREGWNTVVTTAREPLVPWRGAAAGFRDTRLFELTAPVAEIEVSTLRDSAATEDGRGTNHFILRQRGSNDWQIVGEKYPADAENVRLFIKALADLRIAEFVKDAVITPILTNYDLAAPQREIILRSKADDTNAIIAELDFGAVQTNEIFVLRPDENFVYAVKEQDFNLLKDAAWEFRDRRIWNFRVEDVSQITIHQDGKTRQIVHNGPGKWSLATGSQGFIEDRNIEQTVQMFHQLFAVGWVAHNFAGPEIGIYTNSLQITLELKNGEKDAVDFGAEYPQSQTALAGVTLDGERWGFVLPPALYQLTASYLTIPANVP